MVQYDVGVGFLEVEFMDFDLLLSSSVDVSCFLYILDWQEEKEVEIGVVNVFFKESEFVLMEDRDESEVLDEGGFLIFSEGQEFWVDLEFFGLVVGLVQQDVVFEVGMLVVFLEFVLQEDGVDFFGLYLEVGVGLVVVLQVFKVFFSNIDLFSCFFGFLEVIFQGFLEDLFGEVFLFLVNLVFFLNVQSILRGGFFVVVDFFGLFLLFVDSDFQFCFYFDFFSEFFNLDFVVILLFFLFVYSVLFLFCSVDFLYLGDLLGEFSKMMVLFSNLDLLGGWVVWIEMVVLVVVFMLVMEGFFFFFGG